MGFLDRILNRGGAKVAEAEQVQDEHECLHVALSPAWDDVDDIGIEERAVRYDCGTCGATFTPEEAQRLRATEAERIKGDTNN